MVLRLDRPMRQGSQEHSLIAVVGRDWKVNAWDARTEPQEVWVCYSPHLEEAGTDLKLFYGVADLVELSPAEREPQRTPTQGQYRFTDYDLSDERILLLPTGSWVYGSESYLNLARPGWRDEVFDAPLLDFPVPDPATASREMWSQILAQPAIPSGARPVGVRLKSGREIDGVFLVNAGDRRPSNYLFSFLQPWEPIIPLDLIDEVLRSPSSLPPRLQVLAWGRGVSGMGYLYFTAIFSDGSKQAYDKGDDDNFFLSMPAGKRISDIVDVERTQQHKEPLGTLPTAKCFYRAPD